VIGVAAFGDRTRGTFPAWDILNAALGNGAFAWEDLPLPRLEFWKRVVSVLTSAF